MFKDLGTQIAPYRDGEPSKEEWSQTSEGRENGKALRAAGTNDVLRTIGLRDKLASIYMNPNGIVKTVQK